MVLRQVWHREALLTMRDHNTDVPGILVCWMPVSNPWASPDIQMWIIQQALEVERDNFPQDQLIKSMWKSFGGHTVLLMVAQSIESLFSYAHHWLCFSFCLKCFLVCGVILVVTWKKVEMTGYCMEQKGPHSMAFTLEFCFSKSSELTDLVKWGWCRMKWHVATVVRTHKPPGLNVLMVTLPQCGIVSATLKKFV